MSGVAETAVCDDCADRRDVCSESSRDFLEPRACDCLEDRFLLEFAESQVGQSAGDAEMRDDIADLEITMRICGDECKRLSTKVHARGEGG